MVAIQVAINNPRTSAANPSPYAIHTQTLVVDRPSSPETERFHLQSDASAWDAQISISSSQRASTEHVDRPSDGRSEQKIEAHATDAEARIVKLEQQIVSMIASAGTSPPKVIEPPSPKAAAVSTDSAILFRHLKTIRAILASQPPDPGAQGVGGCVVYEQVDISGVSIGIASSGKKTDGFTVDNIDDCCQLMHTRAVVRRVGVRSPGGSLLAQARRRSRCSKF